MTLRIIGGKYKGLLLKTPKSTSTRPTQGMLREAVFNICQNQINDARFLDLFAGSGAIGFEALSRGASHVTFVEQNKIAIACLKENIAKLNVALQTQLLPLPAARALPFLAKQSKFNLVYIDPPYDTPFQSLLEGLKPLLAPHATVFIEERHSPKIQQTPPEFPFLQLIDSRRFGIALLHQYQFKI
ncbi:MAG TPA: 16S rRNA (guanine(966)-N(2))-methyltransferase RsmD [Chlamydiales bacterium]|nr:16S rRNA (guanine(966)-N(2))-methyltransferase RsmD [Chlamydiales bacterium]